MKYSFLMFVIVLAFNILANSQSCLPQGIAFTNQVQIDSFQVNYPGCTEIEGDVWIKYSDITKLEGLNVITKISGNLNIDSTTQLSNFEGLNSLTLIGGSLNITYTTYFNDMQGLNSLEIIEEAF